MTTKTEIALNAIRGTTLTRTTHLVVMSTMQALRLTTDEAVALRKMVVREWLASDYDTTTREVFGIAKTVINSYARDVSFRAAG
jgi:hypothetical protein